MALDLANIKFSPGYSPEDIPEKWLCWLAGILEGEGCFSSKCNKCYIILQMSDLDTVQRAADLMEVKLHAPITKKNPKHKIAYRFQVNGGVAARWMVVLSPKLGSRRQRAIAEYLVVWRGLKGKGSPKHIKATKCPHSDQKHYGKGMCHSCWIRCRRASKGLPIRLNPELDNILGIVQNV